MTSCRISPDAWWGELMCLSFQLWSVPMKSGRWDPGIWKTILTAVDVCKWKVERTLNGGYRIPGVSVGQVMIRHSSCSTSTR